MKIYYNWKLLKSHITIFFPRDVALTFHKTLFERCGRWMDVELTSEITDKQWRRLDVHTTLIKILKERFSSSESLTFYKTYWHQNPK